MPLSSSPPSLTHSRSASSQTSLPQPSTPPRGRLPSRYPSNLGRVPLHRRGTSKTYERLEDLLREAGYKETRIFTPEGEHDPDGQSDGSKADSKRTSVRESVGAVVGFLAGLMPSVASRNNSLLRAPPAQATDAHKHSDDPHSGTQSDVPQVQVDRPHLPLSPFTQTQQSHRRPTRQLAESSTAPTFTPASSVENLNQAPPIRRPTASTINVVHPPRRYRPAPLPLPNTTPTVSLSPTINTHPNPRPDTLRHMASTPSILPQQRRHWPSPLNDSDVDADADTDDAPPLPRTWLENVARAVLFGGPGTHVGGPDTAPHRASSHSARHHPRTTYGRGRSNGRPGLGRGCAAGTVSDHALGLTSKHTMSSTSLSPRVCAAALLAPPPLCVRVQATRAGTSSGMVSRTAVVCRSAPASRAGSRVREGGSGGLLGKGEAGGVFEGLSGGSNWEKRHRAEMELRRQRRERGREKARRKSVRDDGVPSLARTQAEGDIWSRVGGRGGSRFVGGDEESDEDDGDDGSSEGELDLAQMLVPPKRQYSIRSLRRHLHGQGSGRGSVGRTGVGANRSGAATPVWSDEEEEGWIGEGWRRKRGRRDSGNEDEEGYPIAGLLSLGEGSWSGNSGMGKRRRGIPGVWAQWAGVGS
jgi:hypothetical protein